MKEINMHPWQKEGEFLIAGSHEVSCIRFPSDRILRRYFRNRKGSGKVRTRVFLASEKGIIPVQIGKNNRTGFRLFRKNKICVKCGRVGSIVSLNRIITETGKIKYFFQLYGLSNKGKLVLMTKDHIHPKSKGGTNTKKNFQTMCIFCNQAKGDKIEKKKVVQKEKELVAV